MLAARSGLPAAEHELAVFHRQRPETVLAGTFLGLIVIGSVLLALPVAHADGPVSWLDAFFTATSAVCVTGLITVDTATAWSRFGQSVILLLIQLGGLGIMTFGALAAQLFFQRLSFASDAAWKSTFFQGQFRTDFRSALYKIVLLTLVIEFVGTAVLLIALRAEPDGRGGSFEAVFLAVSAFCNAGFAPYTENAVALRQAPLALATISVLVILGGLGYPVLLELSSRANHALRRQRHARTCWSLQTRMVIYVSAILVVTGAGTLFLAGMADGPDSLPERAAFAIFQSISARTAGFNTVDIAAVSTPGLLIIIALMFVGGSPGSCAGGIKTTTAAVWTARIRARLTGSKDVNLWGRAIPHDIVRRAALVLALAVLWNLIGVMILTITEGSDAVRFEHLIFEQVSAFGTVGLSTGLTPELSVVGKLWIIASMFVGRLGPLTMALAVLEQPRTLYRYPTEQVMIG